jgi:hypothetical protein
MNVVGWWNDISEGIGMNGKTWDQSPGARGTVQVGVRIYDFGTTVGLAQCFTESGLAGRRTRSVGVGVTVTLQCPPYRAAGFLESTGRFRNEVMNEVQCCTKERCVPA